jgi:formylglycine-generating enzyme required for sulfatase activity
MMDNNRRRKYGCWWGGLLLAIGSTMFFIPIFQQNSNANLYTCKVEVTWPADIDGSVDSAGSRDVLWLFLKYQDTMRPQGQREWRHAEILGCDSSPYRGFSTIISHDGMGIVLVRDEAEKGGVQISDFSIEWRPSQGVLNHHCRYQLFAIPMVYVPTASFYVGGSGEEVGAFYAGGHTLNTPFQIVSEAALLIRDTIGGLWGRSEQGDHSIGREGALPSAFPKGFHAFLCMKEEITQGQYRDFLNTLSRKQQVGRVCMDFEVGHYVGGYVWSGKEWNMEEQRRLKRPGNRLGVRLIEDKGAHIPMVFACDLQPSAPPYLEVNEADDGADLSMGQLNWADLTAFLDWAALRPLTELEFEKAGKGSAMPYPNGYAWGSSPPVPLNDTDWRLFDRDSSEAGTVVFPNALYGNQPMVQGPTLLPYVDADRQYLGRRGSSIYGIQSLSGGMWERAVSVSLDEGRKYRGSHGDGVLSSDGFANERDWPGYILGFDRSAEGSCFRGGSWYTSSVFMRIADRYYGHASCVARFSVRGGRGGRTAYGYPLSVP